MRSARFYCRSDTVDVAWRRLLPAAVIGAPVMVEARDAVLVCETTGTVRAIARESTAQLWEYRVDAAILGSAVVTPDPGVIFGASDGIVTCLGPGGKPVWRYAAGAPIYGTPTLDGMVVLIGDAAGRMHAIDITTAKARWVCREAQGGIRAAPAVDGDRVIFGSLDGKVYCVDKTNGKLQWCAPCASMGDASAVHTPADATPVIVGDRVFVCDSGGRLAWFAADGKPGGVVAKDIAAVVGSSDGKGLYVRGRKDRVFRLDGEGKVVWEARVPTGRFPIPPTEHGGQLYVCADQGRLTALDAKTGRAGWAYQVTAGEYVLGAVGVDAAGACYIVALDGLITRLRGKSS
jgi:outer membrane protein assembly factor BamB